MNLSRIDKTQRFWLGVVPLELGPRPFLNRADKRSCNEVPLESWGVLWCLLWADTSLSVSSKRIYFLPIRRKGGGIFSFTTSKLPNLEVEVEEAYLGTIF